MARIKHTGLALALLLGAAGLPAHAAAADFVVQATFPSYTINGQQNPPLVLLRGNSYTFQVSATGHPFYIKMVQSTGTGGTFDTGVSGNGVQNGVLTFQVPQSAPNQLFYNCSIHSSMTGPIAIVTASAAPALGGFERLVLIASCLVLGWFILRRRNRERHAPPPA